MESMEFISTPDTLLNGTEKQLLVVLNVLDIHVNLTAEPRPHLYAQVASSHC
jgi:hypothetical protein